jgi:hypothetical protein
VQVHTVLRSAGTVLRSAGILSYEVQVCDIWTTVQRTGGFITQKTHTPLHVRIVNLVHAHQFDLSLSLPKLSLQRARLTKTLISLSLSPRSHTHSCTLSNPSCSQSCSHPIVTHLTLISLSLSHTLIPIVFSILLSSYCHSSHSHSHLALALTHPHSHRVLTLALILLPLLSLSLSSRSRPHPLSLSSCSHSCSHPISTPLTLTFIAFSPPPSHSRSAAVWSMISSTC